MSQEKSELAEIRKELNTISTALTLIAINQVDAKDADERERHVQVTLKALDVLIRRMEGR